MNSTKSVRVAGLLADPLRGEVRSLIRFAAVSIGSGGVAPCVRCGRESSSPAAAGDVLADLAAALAAHPDGVVLTGIEPFTHPSLVEIITSAKGVGAARIGIQTDGAALGVGQNAPGSVGAGVRFFEFVFLGGDAPAHDSLAGRDGAFASLAAGVAAVKRLSTPERRIFIGAVVRICPHNIDRFVDVVAGAVAAGVRSVRVELCEGVTVSREVVDRAHAIATTAGVSLFGDGCGHILCGARLYEYAADTAASEVTCG